MTWDIACLLWDRKGLLSGWGEGGAWTVRALGLSRDRPLPRGADSRGVGSQGRARGQWEAGGWPKAPVKERYRQVGETSQRPAGRGLPCGQACRHADQSMRGKGC